MITKDELLADILKVKKQLGHLPAMREYVKLGKYSPKPFQTHCGSWGNALTMLGEQIPKGGRPSFKHIGDEPEIYDKFPRINANKVMIIFDPHVPFHDVELHEEMLRVAKKLKIRTLVIGGDGVDFKSLYRKETQKAVSDWIQDLKIYENYIETLCTNFDVVHDIMGNHNWRLARMLGKSEQMVSLYDLIFRNPKYKPSQYFYALLNDWLYIVHPDRMRKVKLSLPEELCDHYRKSVITSHSHRFSWGIHDSGIDIIGDGLCMTKSEYHEYHGVKLDTFSSWVQGFWILMDNKIVPFVKHERIKNFI